MRKLVGSIGALGIVMAGCSDAARPVAPDGPSLSRAGAAGGKYIVVFNDDVQDAPGLARRLAEAHGASPRFTYQHAIKGFAAELPEAAVEALRNNPNVAYVEADAPVELFETPALQTQSSPPSWGTDRVDQRDLPLSRSYSYNYDGAGTNVYIFDTGIRLSHVDFGGRAFYAPAGVNGNTQGNFVPDGAANANDCHGHGTHVAGTAAGATYGLAKGATVWAARVVNCQGGGDVSYAIAAVDWCTASCARPAVVNMSLGYGNVQSLRDAVERSVAAGVNYAVAAGNGNFLGIPQNACGQSPAGAPNANTVGATTSSDNESSFSNYGPCVDILAPGSSIVSASHSSNTGSATMSGTSMATPHVAGAIALLLQEDGTLTPAGVTALLKSRATSNTITLHSSSSLNGTPNLFLYTNPIGDGGGGGGGGANVAPVVSAVSKDCGGFTCTFTATASDANGDALSYAWTFGDGDSATGNPATNSYPSNRNATYTVTVTVSDGKGGTASGGTSVTCNRKKGFCQ